MDSILQGLESYAAAYHDDLVIHSSTWEEHRQQDSLPNPQSATSECPNVFTRATLWAMEWYNLREANCRAFRLSPSPLPRSRFAVSLDWLGAIEISSQTIPALQLPWWIWLKSLLVEPKVWGSILETKGLSLCYQQDVTLEGAKVFHHRGVPGHQISHPSI